MESPQESELQRSPVTIRSMAKEDCQTVYDMMNKLIAYQKLDKTKIDLEEFNRTSGLFAEGRKFFDAIVAETGEQIIGYILYYFTLPTSCGLTLHMEDIYVDGQFRKSGTGRKLLQEAVRRAQVESCSFIKFRVLDWNPAIGFYEKMGATFDGIPGPGPWLSYTIDSSRFRGILAE